MPKNLYEIIIVMNRESFIEYRYAYSEKQARMIGARFVAKRHGVLPVVVFQYMKEHPDCCKVTIENEIKEIEND